MTENYDRPLPVIISLNRPFWEGAKRHELMIYRCLNCGTYYIPPTHCIVCNKPDMSWVKAKGKGKIYTFIVYHIAYHPKWKKHLPYNVAWVELEEGPLIMTNITGCKNEDLHIDMPVEVTFDDVSNEITIPKFKPVTKK
jgi:uncharacterized OB-fold protein